MNDDFIVAITGVGLIGIVCQWLAWRVKLPAILFLLLAGILAGPVSGWLNPDQLFGPLLLPIISLSVAVILFEGSLTLKFKEIKGLQAVIRRLVTTGVLVTWIIIALMTHWLLDFSWRLSLLFGAITVVTGPTVVIPMLRTVRPTANVANILRWEGIVIDPIGALLAVLVFEFIVSEADSGALSQTLMVFCKTMVLSSLIGGVVGYGFGQFIRHHWLPEYLHNVCALGLVFGVFTAANAVQHESGLLAVTVMGVCLANMKRVPTEDILNFKESLSILLISGLFILLAARINFEHFFDLGWKAAGVFLVIQFLARPLKILLATWGTSLNRGEKLLMAWIAPRGIVAAATAAVFAARLQEFGLQAEQGASLQAHNVLTPIEFAQAELLVPLTFMVIIGTVVLQSITSRFIALRLGVGEPEPKGILIVGANLLARETAKVLHEYGFHVVLADTSWTDIRAARMEGLETYYGNAVSNHADQHLDMTGIGYLLALSEYPEINLLACQHYRTELEPRAIYSIATENHSSVNTRSHYAHSAKTRILFGTDVSLQRLLEMFNHHAKIHKTLLTGHYDFQSFLMDHQQDTIPLFAIKPNGSIEFFVEDNEISAKPEWVVVSLVQTEPSSAPTRHSG
ncbi:MAG: sodium:proton antiporter [Methylobacter sp.]|nr:MAG: sodium:proton antiporter [Methylobacter sp.]